MKYFDQHVHNYYSADSEETIQNFINRAIELDLDTIEFTNHIDLDEEHYLGWRADVDKEILELDEIRKQYPNINIYQGIEIGYCKERFNEVKELIKTHNFNVVNFSMHWWNDVDFYWIDRFKPLGVDATLKMYFSIIIDMINEYDDFDVLTHVDYGFKTIKKIDRSASIKPYESYLTDIFKLLVKKNKALEINTKVQSGIKDNEHLRYLLCLYKSCGGKYLTLSSDAHKADRLCADFNKCLPIIKECGFKYLTVFVKRKPYLIPIEEINLKN